MTNKQVSIEENTYIIKRIYHYLRITKIKLNCIKIYILVMRSKQTCVFKPP